MLRMLTACTTEIDSPEEAADEILAQVDPEKNLGAASLGIISCHPDFLYSGAAKAICDKLPFPVIGATTLASSTNADSGFDLFSLCVLTGDDVSFTTILTDPLLEEGPADRLREAYVAGLERAGGAPSLILAYVPFLPHFGGSVMVNEINAVSGGVPTFGTVGWDSSNGFSDTHTICNGEHYRDRMVLVLVRGAVSPKFFVISVSEGNVRKQKGVITEAEGCILKSVNDLPCVEYMASIGLNPNDGLEGAISVPFIIDYNDGSPPVGRAVYTFTPEGYAICGGEMPLNGTFTVGQLDSREITRASGQLLTSIVEEGDAEGLLVISCGGRSLSLGFEPFAEIAAIREAVGDAVPMHMSYSGGEICPMYTDKGNTVNRFHNFTLIVCRL